MVTISLGAKKKKYNSIKAAAEAAGIPYMTFYMRMRNGQNPATAFKKPVRKYVKKQVEVAEVAAA